MNSKKPWLLQIAQFLIDSRAHFIELKIKLRNDSELSEISDG